MDGAWGYRIDLGPDPATGKRRQIFKQGFRTKRHLARVKLQAITPMQLEKFYAYLLNEGGVAGAGLSPKTVRNTHTGLRKALADVERLELVGRNTAAAARAPSDDRTETVTLSSDEMRIFLDQVSDDRLFAAYILLATTGMRRGEVLGLRWRDVDFDGRELSVANTLSTAGKRGVVSGPPKTPRSRRQIYLDDGTIRILREHRTRQREERLAAGPDWDTQSDWVFTNEIGDYKHPDRFSQEFRRHVDAADLPHVRLHDLRHSYATLALKAGVHPKVVSERLGHATVGITLDLYSHVTPSIARDVADVVASQILG